MSRTPLLAITLISLVLTSACGGSGWRPQTAAATQPPASSESATTDAKAQQTVQRFLQLDPDLERFFATAYGYAVFPVVGKGGMGVGGAYGNGSVYEKNTLVGTASLTELTVGFQLGGQSHSELIFFRDKRAFDDFRNGNFELGAQASAVAITAGASADAAYDNGVAVFTATNGGLMYEATVAGQKFGFEPL